MFTITSLMTISTFILDSVAHSDFLSQVVTKSDVVFKSTRTHENAAHVFATEPQERWSNVVAHSLGSTVKTFQVI